MPTEREEFYKQNREYRNLYSQTIKATELYVKEVGTLPKTVNSLIEHLYHRANRKFIPKQNLLLPGFENESTSNPPSSPS